MSKTLWRTRETTPLLVTQCSDYNNAPRVCGVASRGDIRTIDCSQKPIHVHNDGFPFYFRFMFGIALQLRRPQF